MVSKLCFAIQLNDFFAHYVSTVSGAASNLLYLKKIRLSTNDVRLNMVCLILKIFACKLYLASNTSFLKQFWHQLYKLPGFDVAKGYSWRLQW